MKQLSALRRAEQVADDLDFQHTLAALKRIIERKTFSDEQSPSRHIRPARSVPESAKDGPNSQWRL